jgi:hypothetical protein
MTNKSKKKINVNERNALNKQMLKCHTIHDTDRMTVHIDLFSSTRRTKSTLFFS